MARLLLILVLLATVFWVYSIVDCAVQPSTRHRGVSKGAWIAIVVLLPVLGGLLWFIVGRSGKRAAKAMRAPDDDPEFLNNIGTVLRYQFATRAVNMEFDATSAALRTA